MWILFGACATPLGSRASLASLAPRDWQAAGHDLSRAWYELLGLAGPWVLTAILVAMLIKALVRAPRYRTSDVLGDAEREPVHAALAEVERATSGEIVPVVVERSDPHPAAPWRAALVILAVGTGLLTPHLPWNNPGLFLLCQLGLGGLGFAVACALPDFRRAFIAEDRATATAQEQALQEFFSNGLFKTEQRTGVLLFVSLLEHRVVVLADSGVDDVVGAEAWQSTDRAILEGIRAGSLRDGLIAGIRVAGGVLAEHFPSGDGAAPRNELPNRLIVGRE